MSQSDTPLTDAIFTEVDDVVIRAHQLRLLAEKLERENAALRDLLLRIRREPALTTRGGAGGADNYAGMPPCYRLIDAALNIPWQA